MDHPWEGNLSLSHAEEVDGIIIPIMKYCAVHSQNSCPYPQCNFSQLSQEAL